MEGTLDFDSLDIGVNFQPWKWYRNWLNLTKTLRKYFFRHAKGKSLVNFDISNDLGENWANSESCPILRLL